jgi:C4-dicarboxylate transporter DctM subunit
MILMMLVLMLLLFALGTPIAWSMALAASIYMAFGAHVSLQAMVQRLIGGIDTFPLLAVPFFILAGNLMNTGGITHRLVGLSRALIGHIKGGLAHVVVITNVIMAGMSGSGVADATGTGAVLIPAMKRDGYGAPFSAAIVAAAATIGPIIPPSILFVVYGSLANVSIGRLFLGGAIPGLVMGVCLIIAVYFIAKLRNYPADRRATLREFGRAVLDAALPLGMPLIILGGIVGGVTTPTEAAAAGAAYAFVLGFFVYRELKLPDLGRLIVESAVATAAIGIIISASQPFGWVLAFEQAPAAVVDFVQQLHLSPWELLLALNVIMLVVGCFMEGLAIMVMVTPIILPLLASAGIDPVHFGVVFTLNIMIGNITPPVGMIMYVVCALGKITIAQFTREIWPFLIALLVALAVVTFVPTVTMWLPDTVMPAK